MSHGVGEAESSAQGVRGNGKRKGVGGGRSNSRKKKSDEAPISKMDCDAFEDVCASQEASEEQAAALALQFLSNSVPFLRHDRIVWGTRALRSIKRKSENSSVTVAEEQLKNGALSHTADITEALVKVEKEPSLDQRNEPQSLQKLISDSSNESTMSSIAASPNSPLPLLRVEDFASTGVPLTAGKTAEFCPRLASMRPILKPGRSHKLKGEITASLEVKKDAFKQQYARRKPRPVVVERESVKVEDPVQACPPVLVGPTAEEFKSDMQIGIPLPLKVRPATPKGNRPAKLEVRHKLINKFSSNERKVPLTETQKSLNKMKRAEANRLSARQALLKKREVRDTMEETEQILQKENKQMKEQISLLRQRKKDLEEANSRMREQVELANPLRNRQPVSPAAIQTPSTEDSPVLPVFPPNVHEMTGQLYQLYFPPVSAMPGQTVNPNAAVWFQGTRHCSPCPTLYLQQPTGNPSTTNFLPLACPTASPVVGGGRERDPTHKGYWPVTDHSHFQHEKSNGVTCQASVPNGNTFPFFIPTPTTSQTSGGTQMCVPNALSGLQGLHGLWADMDRTSMRKRYGGVQVSKEATVMNDQHVFVVDANKQKMDKSALARRNRIERMRLSRSQASARVAAAQTLARAAAHSATRTAARAAAQTVESRAL